MVWDPSGEAEVFGRWLRRRRRALDLTQKALARSVGCSPATIRKLEADERRPSRGVAASLARALGVPAEELDAFVRFARSGWADRPPRDASDLERPWLAGAAGDLGAAQVAPWPPALTVAKGALAARTATPVVGRDDELARLADQLDRALSGVGRVVFVRGEAGQGKTTLLWRFAEQAQAAHPELLVVAGACNAYTGTGDPFQPFREALEELTGHVPVTDVDPFDRERGERLLRTLPHAQHALTNVAPVLVGTVLEGAPLLASWSRAGLPSPPAWLVARATRSVVHEGLTGAGPAALRAAITSMITAVSQEAPLLLLLDDLQWVDGSSADTLLHLARSASGHRVLAVGAYRSSDIVDDAGGSPHVMRRVLSEIGRAHQDGSVDLDAADHRAFLEAWLDTEPNRLGRAFREALWRLTGGQPLFTVELLRAMQERGEVAKDGQGCWTLVREVDWNVLPDRIAGVLGDRIARLDPDARDVLRVASVEGETFIAETVARVLARDPRNVTRTAGDELHRRRQLVVPVDVRRRAAGFVSRYRFRHDLIQSYVYEQLDEAERGYLHEAVGSALETLLGEEADPLALANHFLRARAPERAAPHLWKAGDHARENGALEQAVEHYRAALEHGTQSAARERAALLRDLGECNFLRGDLDAALDELRRARALFEAEGALKASNAVLANIGFVLYENHQEDQGLRCCSDAVTALERNPDTAELAMALSMRAQLYMMMDENELSLVDGQRALAVAERLQAEDSRVRALASVAAVLSKGPERREEGFAMLDEGFRAADRRGLENFAIACRGNLGAMLVSVGRFDEGRAAFARALEYARRHGVALHDGWLITELWRLDWRQGRWAEALSQASRLRAMANARGTLHRELAPIPVELAAAALDLGRPEDAAALLDAFQDSLEPVGEEANRLQYLGVRLRIAIAQDRLERADAVAAALVEALGDRSMHQIDIVAPVLWCCRWLARRTSTVASRGLERCLVVLEQTQRQYGAPWARSAWLEGRALAAEGRGALVEAADLALEAAEGWRATGFPFDEARARCAASRALASVGRGGDAERELRTASEILASLARQVPEGEARASFERVQRGMLEGTGFAG